MLAKADQVRMTVFLGLGHLQPYPHPHHHPHPHPYPHLSPLPSRTPPLPSPSPLIDQGLSGRTKDGKLSPGEFVEFCKMALNDIVDLSNLDQAYQTATNYAQALGVVANRTNQRMRAIANRVDRYCRLIVPASYLFVQVLIWNIDPADKYTRLFY